MNEDMENFVRAAQNNEYAEYEFADEFVLVTNSEKDRSFKPWLVIPKDISSEDGIIQLLENEAGETISFNDIEIFHQDKLSFVTIKEAELEVEQ